MVNTVTTNLARGSQERHLSTHSASHLERQQPAGLIYPSLERRNYPELSCIGGLHPAGIPECMPSIYQAAGASVEADGQRSGRAVHQSVRSLLGFQFRPAPALAEQAPIGTPVSSEARERRVNQQPSCGSLAAGRIQFTSAWRNVKTQCDTNATRDDGRSWLLLNNEWNDRPVARLQAGQCFNAQRSNSPRMVGGLAVIPHHLTVSCRFKSCRAHQFYRATLPFWPDQSGARRNQAGNYRPDTATKCGSNRDNVRHIKPVISPYTKLI